MPQLRLLRLNYKGRPIDDTVIDFFRVSCGQLTTLQFFDVKEITLEDQRMTVGQCPQLEVLVFQECSIVPDWRSHSLGNHIKVISCSVDHLQMFALQILPSQVRNAHSGADLLHEAFFKFTGPIRSEIRLMNNLNM